MDREEVDMEPIDEPEPEPDLDPSVAGTRFSQLSTQSQPSTFELELEALAKRQSVASSAPQTRLPALLGSRIPDPILASWLRAPLAPFDPAADDLVFQQIDLDYYIGAPLTFAGIICSIYSLSRPVLISIDELKVSLMR